MPIIEKNLLFFDKKDLHRFSISVYRYSTRRRKRRNRTKKPQDQEDALRPIKKRAARPQGRTAQENSQNAFAQPRKDLEMLRNHAPFNIGSLGSVVNSFVTTLAMLMITGGYFSAIGRIALA